MVTLAAALIAGFGASAAAQPPAAPKPRLNVAILIYDGVELLDWAGPGEVFQDVDEGKAFRVYTVAPSAKPITSQQFVSVTPQFSVKDCPPPDVLVVPGGGSSQLLRDEAFMKWLGETVPKTKVTLSVCTGTFVLAKAGLLDGKEAATHWAFTNSLAERFPKVKVKKNVRFVDSGQIVTAAGVSAGIDGALHVVARLNGRKAAEQAARYMEYRWQPEEASKDLQGK